MLAEVEISRNRTGVPPMPIKTVDIALDEIGYMGWSVTMRTNPRCSVYDALLAFDDQDDPNRWWRAFGQIVQRWNFSSENGEAIPQPKDVESEKDLDLPHGVIAFVFTRYLEAFNAAAQVPKVRPEASAPTSSISEGSPKSE